MSFFVVTTVVYNLAYARLLFVAGIDQRLPRNIGMLNKNHVPANAIIFQTVVASVITGLIFFVAPYISFLGTPQPTSPLRSTISCLHPQRWSGLYRLRFSS
jgi:amino acid transporter